MPYVNLKGLPRLQELEDGFEPQSSVPGAIVKFGKRYISVDRLEWLIDVVAVDTGGAARQGSQHFYILVKETEGRLSIRLDPKTDPFKSPAVHAAVAAVARWFLQSASGATVDRHGLGEESFASLQAE